MRLCLDMILTDKWTREVAKHEKTINELERRYEEKCKALKVCFEHLLYGYNSTRALIGC